MNFEKQQYKKIDDNIRFIDPDPFNVLKEKYNNEIKENITNINKELDKLLKSNPNVTQKDLDNLLVKQLKNKKIDNNCKFTPFTPEFTNNNESLSTIKLKTDLNSLNK